MVSVKPTPPYTPRIELNASVLFSCTPTRSITACGLKNAITLTDNKLNAESRMKPMLATVTMVCFFMCLCFLLMQRCVGVQTQFLVFTKIIAPADLADYADKKHGNYLCDIRVLSARLNFYAVDELAKVGSIYA